MKNIVKAERNIPIKGVAVGLLVLILSGCDRSAPTGSLVLTQAPASVQTHSATDTLSARYPIGSRVMLRETPFEERRERVLSGTLVAAGGPVVSYDGLRVYFVGKSAADADWQIYETALASAGPRRVTSMPGGAMSPTLLPDGNLAFISPVPQVNAASANGRPAALFVQSPGGQPRQLTFGSNPIIDSTMLGDGRILFVAMKNSPSNSAPECALYTINSDGTEVAVFAEQKGSASLIQKPRQILADGRIAFIDVQTESPASRVKFVRMARPSLDGSLLLSNVNMQVLSVQTGGDDDFLVCAETPPGNACVDGPSNNLALPAVFRARSGAPTLGAAIISDPQWSFLEAVEAAPHRAPMGRLSTLDFTRHTGKILCLDANFTRDASQNNQSVSAAACVRVTAEVSPGVIKPLGEIPVQADGSFLAEVPAEVPLGFEVTDASGRLLRQSPPSMWVMPGENRSCVGCHEPRNRAPHNHRPLAVNVPLVQLTLKDVGVESRKSN